MASVRQVGTLEANASATSIAPSWPAETVDGSFLVAKVAVRDDASVPDWTTVPSDWTPAVEPSPQTVDTPQVQFYVIPDAAPRSGSETFAHDGAAQPVSAQLFEVEPAAGETLTLDEVASLITAGGGTTDRDTGTTPTTGGQTVQIGAVAIRNASRTLASIKDSFTERANAPVGSGFAGMTVATGTKSEAAAEEAATGWTVNNPSGSQGSGAILTVLVEEAGGEPVEGDVANVLPGLTQAAAAALTASVAAATVLPGLVSAATAEAAVEATAAQTLPPLEQAAEGTVEVEGVTGTAESVLPALDQALAAEAAVSASASAVLPSLGQSVQGTVTVRGEAAGMLGQLVSAMGGELTVAGEGASLLPALEQALSGALPVSAAIEAVLPALLTAMTVERGGVASAAVTDRTLVTLGPSRTGLAVAGATDVELDSGETHG